MKKRNIKRIILFTIIGLLIAIILYTVFNWEQIWESEAFQDGLNKGMGIQE